MAKVKLDRPRPRPAAAGDIFIIELNGSRFTERFNGTRWIIIKVEAA